VIRELRVRHLATIEDVTLQLGPGLNVLTGETGAGKSMLVDALALLLGERATSESVRPGASRAVVEGAFELSDRGLQSAVEALGLDVVEDAVVIRREIPAEGGSRAWVNGSPTTVGVLAKLGRLLVDLHGQHETQSLLHSGDQRDMLDAFGHAEAECRAMAEAFEAVVALKDDERSLTDRREEVERRADYLRHVVGEIDTAHIELGEDDALAVEARKLSQATALEDNARTVSDAATDGDGNALDALHRADRALQALEQLDPDVSAWRELLETAHANLSELGRAAADYAAGLERDPSRLAEIEARRDLLFDLKRKHGGALEAVLATRDDAQRELEVLDTAEVDLRALAARRHAAEAALVAAADRLGDKRRAAAARLTQAVTRLLPRLGLGGGKLLIELPPHDEAVRSGRESVSFSVQLNVGLEPRPLKRVASGGELSRIMLALKVALARHDRIPTLVFDEVDQGIGANVGTRVGQALAEVAEGRQVLVITHLAPIAAQADRHLVVSKRARRGIATSDVQVIHGEDRVLEVARMLGDAEGKAARRHALEMLGVSRKSQDMRL
jgi:DNA repair protein RecN (Recombination protein N)